MKLLEIANNDKIYHAELSFISRGNSRKGQWSTKGLQAALAKHGYNMEPYSNEAENVKEKPLIQKVMISGTRNEIIKQRNEISRIIRIHTQGVHRPVFKLLN